MRGVADDKAKLDMLRKGAAEPGVPVSSVSVCRVRC